MCSSCRRRDTNKSTVNQKAHEHQILHGELARIANAPSPQKGGKARSEFFCVENNSRAHGKNDYRYNKGLCNAARLECNIYSIDWPPKSLDINAIENVWRFIKQRLRNWKPYEGWTLDELKQNVVDI
jgi:hypothetical protein